LLFLRVVSDPHQPSATYFLLIFVLCVLHTRSRRHYNYISESHIFIIIKDSERT
jgi:hypothetical protein